MTLWPGNVFRITGPLCGIAGYLKRHWAKVKPMWWSASLIEALWYLTISSGCLKSVVWSVKISENDNSERNVLQSSVQIYASLSYLLIALPARTISDIRPYNSLPKMMFRFTIFKIPSTLRGKHALRADSIKDYNLVSIVPWVFLLAPCPTAVIIERYGTV